LYTEENVAISGIHTHAGPGGYLQYVVYSVTSLGFVKQSFDAIANAVEQSIIQAHNNLKPGSIFINTGEKFLSLQYLLLQGHLCLFTILRHAEHLLCCVNKYSTCIINDQLSNSFLLSCDCLFL